MEPKQVRWGRAVSLIVGMIVALGVLSPRAFAQTNPVLGANQAAVAPVSPPATGAEDSAATDVAAGFSPAINNAALKGASTGSRQAAPNAATRARVIQTYGKLPLAFEANYGQTDPQVKFLARGGGYTLFLTGDEAVLSLWQAETGKQKTEGRGKIRNSKVGNRNPKIRARHLPLVTDHSPVVAQAVVRMKLVGANSKATVTGLAELPGKSNYFIGNDPKKWHTDVPNYAQVRYQNVYPGIDLVYYGNQGQLEYDFAVAPGADPAAIRLDVAPGLAPPSRQTVQHLRGRAQQAAPLRVAPNGDLVMRLNGGEVRFHKPVVYQPAVAPVSLRLAQGRLPSATGTEDSAATEVAAGFSPAIEKQNPCPAKAGLYGPAQPCVAAGPASLSTGVAAASAGNPKSAIQNRKYLDGRYVLRGNNQVGFEVASYDRRQPLIIDPVLMYSSLIGGDGGSVGAGVAVDGLGDVFLTGRAWDDFPQVNKIPGACQECGGSAVFVTKINAAGNALVYSSLIGGSSLQGAAGIAVDGSGSAYLTGVTQSTDFPRVHQIPGACNGKCGTGYPIENAFVTKISAAGNALVYSSYIGGSGYPPNGVPTGDAAYSIAVDGLANAYLTGTSDSPDFPIVNQIPGACNGLCGTVAGNVFVTKMNAAGSALLYSSRVGGSNNDIGYGVALDGSGNAYLTGSTGSTDFPRVHQIPGACNGTCGTASGKGDAFVTKINAAGSALVYSSYVGGGGTRYSIGDFGYGIAVDGSGNAYLTGETTSTDFPIVNQIPGACNGTCGSNKNPVIFATKVNAAGSALVYSSLIGGSGGPNDFGDRGYAIAVDGSGNAYLTGESFSHDFPRVKQVPGACNGTCGARFTSSAFVTEINAAGSALNNSSLIGGSGSSGAGGDAGTGVAVDAAGNVYLTGLTNSADFPRVNQIPGACSGGCGDGFGYAVFVLKIITPTTPFIVLAPTSLTFAPQGVQAPNFPQTVTLTNGGVLPLSITGITLTGLNAGDFTQANSCPLSPNTLGPNDYCAITVVFAPTGAGTLNADVTLADNAPGSPQNVPLTGVGVSGKPGLAGPRSRH